MSQDFSAPVHWQDLAPSSLRFFPPSICSSLFFPSGRQLFPNPQPMQNRCPPLRYYYKNRPFSLPACHPSPPRLIAADGISISSGLYIFSPSLFSSLSHSFPFSYSFVVPLHLSLPHSHILSRRPCFLSIFGSASSQNYTEKGNAR